MTYKKKFKNSVILLMPFLIIGIALASGNLFARYGEKAALVLAGAQMPSESVGLMMDELEGESDEDIQKKIDNLKIPEVTKPEIDKNPSYTPDDIKSLIEAAKVAQANATPTGSIKEVTYGASNATNVYDNVTVKNATDEHSIDIEKCLKTPCVLSVKNKTDPLVLIYHTHTTEAYEMLDRGYYCDDFPTRSSDPSTNMVRVGDALCAKLEAAGYTVIHDKEIHDTSYTGSYSRSREAIENYKKQYPSLQIIIDVHRDGIKSADGTKTKPVATINGRKSAQIMIIAGCEEGKVKEFKGWENNLNFAVQLQKCAEDLYPGLMRPIYFSPRKYNMDTSPCGILLEMGSDSNTLEEAVYAGEMIGTAMANLISTYEK